MWQESILVHSQAPHCQALPLFFSFSNDNTGSFFSVSPFLNALLFSSPCYFFHLTFLSLMVYSGQLNHLFSSSLVLLYEPTFWGMEWHLLLHYSHLCQINLSHHPPTDICPVCLMRMLSSPSFVQTPDRKSKLLTSFICNEASKILTGWVLKCRIT